MARRLPWLLFAAVLCGCGSRPSLSGDAWEALREAEEVELVSLDPMSPEEPAPDMLYHWRVLGRAKSTSPQIRKELVQALENAVFEEPVGASCFMPRHAIVASHGGHKYEILICFGCGYVRWNKDGHQQGKFLIGGEQHKVYDRIYQDAGLTIAE